MMQLPVAMITIMALVGLFLFPDAAQAEWRSTCDYPQFNIIWGAPFMSTICRGSSQGPLCVMLDLSHCYMNSHGHLAAVQNGHFERSCRDCHFTGENHTVFACNCEMFGRDAPWQYTEIETNDLVENKDGLLACWDGGQRKCPGQP
ncbi:hypothetical protein F5X96DRAFT_666177 [Biscogniauxia mediterranea]|nr:hypothetical protein F5X96DRAFT_666177 [Biscogniauxia mediterranea]